MSTENRDYDMYLRMAMDALQRAEDPNNSDYDRTQLNKAIEYINKAKEQLPHPLQL